MSKPAKNQRRSRYLAPSFWLRLLRTTPGLPLILFLLACVDTVGLAVLDAANHVEQLTWRDTVSHQAGIDASRNFADFAVPYFRDQALLLLVCLVPAFVVTLLRRRGRELLLPVAVACLAIFVVGLASDLFANYRSAAESFLGEKPTPGSYFIKLALIGFVSLSPPLLLALYLRSSTLDRYVVRSFLTPFALCLLGFLAIWLIIDLADNGPDFVEASNPPNIGTIVGMYVGQLPHIVVLILDVAILLALLYTLGRMSRSNEIISMLGAGRSVWRIVAPLILFGTYASLVSLAFNYQWAPQAEREKEKLLSSLDEKYEQKTAARAVLYRNRDDLRTWFIGTIPIDISENNLKNVEVYQQNEAGRVVWSLVAKSANWFPDEPGSVRGSWKFYKGRVQHFDDRGIPIREEPFPSSIIYEGWRESPWKLQSGSLRHEFLGVQELRSYLATNADLPPVKLAPFRTELAYRWALPWRCLVVTLIAAPLGIVFSRRGLLGGVASCMLIYFSIFFVTAVSLAMGEGGRIPPGIAAWGPGLLFAAIGVALLAFRNRNRELPKLSPARLLRRQTA